MLELAGVRFRREAFSLAADFSVPARRRVAVIGPSGAGKSTLLALIAGFESADAGTIRWDGRDLSGLPPGKRPVSMVFQDNNLFPHLTVAQNIGLGLSPALRLGDGDGAKVASVLDRVGLTGMSDRKPEALSGGQQSRVALARTLVRNRPLVLLDEPFSALGPALKASMLDLLVDVTAEAGMTVLIVTHDPGDASRVADDTVFVDAGVAHAPVDTRSLFADPPAALSRYMGT